MDLQPRSRDAFLDADALMKRLCPDVTAGQLKELAREHRALDTLLRARYIESELAFPENYAVAHGASFVLYAWTRLSHPQVVVETGVANGHSTFFLLHALAMNERGTLHSFDVSEKAGSLLEDGEREPWEFHILPKRDRERRFVASIEALGTVELFHHDSLHSYEWQTLEYETIRRTSPQCLITSDDVDGSFAFVDFCERYDRRAYYLVDTRKVFGVVA